MIDLVAHLLGAAAELAPIASLPELRARTKDVAARFTSTVDRAAALGLAADRLGYACAGGYGAALVRLDPAIGERAASLCATERAGGHPRHIETRLSPSGDGWTLSGAKSWVTLASSAAVLLVVASVGVDAASKNRLRVARVPSDRAGVTLTARAPAPFAPEIDHGEARFDVVEVAAHELLAGDGYDGVLKPFRTLEDIHVLAAAAGHLVGVARAYAWPRAWIEEALALVVTLRALGDEDASRREVHLVLAGVFEAFGRLVASADASWASAPAVVRERWSRDRPLLGVASSVRAMRREAAWR
jgi:acyl-CoA dehydrogenase